MAIGKTKIVVYADWKDSFNELTDEEAGKLIKHFFSYVNDEKPVLEDRLLKITWLPIEKTLKRDLKKWEQKASTARENGKLGGRPKNQEEPKKTDLVISETEENPKKAVSVSVRVSDSVNDNVTVKKKNIEDRKREFANSLTPYVEQFGRKTILDFYSYWSEHGEKDRKFRKEKEKSFSIERRLRTWKEREKNFAPKKEKEPTINRQTKEVIEENAKMIPIEFIEKIRNGNG